MVSIVGDLLREETRLKTQVTIYAKTTNLDAVCLTSRNRSFAKSKGEDKNKVQCRFCNEFGHAEAHCKKKNQCNYCKRSGHIILLCRILSKPKQNHASASNRNLRTNTEYLQSAFLISSAERNIMDAATNNTPSTQSIQ